MVAKFTTRTERILREAGWYPGRLIDASPIVQSLSSAGFQVFPHAEEFLSEFGNLEINSDPYPIYITYDDPARYESAFKALKDHRLEEIAKQSLCLIGRLSSHGGSWTLYVGINGKVYQYFASYFDCIGENYIEALQYLISQLKPPSLERLYPSDDSI